MWWQGHVFSSLVGKKSPFKLPCWLFRVDLPTVQPAIPVSCIIFSDFLVLRFFNLQVAIWKPLGFPPLMVVSIIIFFFSCFFCVSFPFLFSFLFFFFFLGVLCFLLFTPLIFFSWECGIGLVSVRVSYYLYTPYVQDCSWF